MPTDRPHAVAVPGVSLPPAMSDQTDSTRPIPARRRPLFEGPLFWIGLIVFGLVLAGALSFLPARGDAESAKPDVGAFCAQVDVLGSTDLLSLVAGVTAGPGLLLPGSSTATTESSTTTGPALDQLDAFEQKLVALERVAPHEVRTDVHEVRLAVDDVLTSLRQSGATGVARPTGSVAASAATLSLSSMTRRWAPRRPMPGTEDRVARFSVAMAVRKSPGVSTDTIASASFGPTPVAD